jgi:hypothetical protein
MCQCSGDFMAERFRNDVWPIAARQLGESLQSNEDLRSSQRPFGGSQRLKREVEHKQLKDIENGLSLSTEVEKPWLRWSESEKALIITILQCLSYAIGNEECGKSLYTILAPVGAVLLPFLGVDDPEVADLAMNCLGKILSIDCDIMLRSLLEVSGRGLPLPPLRLRKNNQSSRKIAVQNFSQDTNSTADVVSIQSHADQLRTVGISKRCLELLDFIESLPEQTLL